MADVGPVLYEVEGAFWEEQFSRSFPAERFFCPGIEFPGDVVELVLGKQRQIRCLWEVLGEQTVDVFGDASFPRSMGMSEIDSDPSIFSQGLVLAHFAALVKGHGTAHLAFKAIENRGKGLRDRVSFTIGQLHQGDKEGLCAPPECRPERGFPRE